MLSSRLRVKMAVYKFYFEMGSKVDECRRPEVNYSIANVPKFVVNFYRILSIKLTLTKFNLELRSRVTCARNSSVPF